MRDRRAKKVLVFGVFDGLHAGHRAFLRAAKRLGDHLTVVTALDSVVARLKGRKPARGLRDRMRHLRRVDQVDAVIQGDSRLGAYRAVQRSRPYVIALGYDQKALRRDLLRNMERFSWRPKIKIMKPHRPRKLHSKLLQRN